MDPEATGTRGTQREARAFAERMARYQDFALACAFARLGDAELAEDAVQEAFLVAWRRQDRLREPRAFAAWLRRIVASRCARIRRARRLRFEQLDHASHLASPVGDPVRRLERCEWHHAVRASLGTLPPAEREAALLFYLEEHSLQEIADFLAISPGAVAKRLHDARRRLRRPLEIMVGDAFGSLRPPRDAAIARAQRHRLRAPAAADWDAIAGIASGTIGVGPAGAADWTARRRAFDEKRHARRHCVIEDARTGRAFGYGGIEQGPERVPYRVHLMARPGDLRGGVGDLLLDRLLVEARSLAVRILWAREPVARREAITLFKRRGFVETRRAGRIVHLERGSAAEPAPFRLEARLLDQLAGEYVHPSGRVLSLRRAGGRLVGTHHGLAVELLPISDTEFFVRPFCESVRFTRTQESPLSLVVRGQVDEEVLVRRHAAIGEK